MKSLQITRILSFAIIFSFCTFTFASDIYHPVAHWTFDESSGTTAYDSAGVSNGTLMNGTARTAGKYGNALQFDGTNDYVEISGTNDTAIEFTKNNSFTISCWAKPLSNYGGYLVTKMRSTSQGNGTFGYEVAYGSAKLFGFAIDSSNAGSTIINMPSNSAPMGEWYHIVATYDNTHMSIYQDGLLYDTDTFTYNTGTTFPGKNMAIGAYSIATGITSHFNGLIDDVRIYNYALNSGEVAQLYEIPEPATILLFSLGGLTLRKKH